MDGELREPGGAALPADIPGVLRGDGIFETFLVEDGAPPPEIAAHAARLHHSAALLELPAGHVDLAAELDELLPHLGGGRWRVRFTLLRGLNGRLIRVWTAGPADPPPEEVSLLLSRFRRDPEDPLAGAKTVSRAGYEAAKREARRQGAWDSLHVTTDGDVSECSSANLFLVRAGKIRTPSVERAILKGVTRDALIRAWTRDGFQVEEGIVTVQELAEAEEVFITSAGIGLVPIRRILGVPAEYPGRDGTWCQRLRESWRGKAPRSPDVPTH